MLYSLFPYDECVEALESMCPAAALGETCTDFQMIVTSTGVVNYLERTRIFVRSFPKESAATLAGLLAPHKVLVMVFDDGLMLHFLAIHAYAKSSDFLRGNPNDN